MGFILFDDWLYMDHQGQLGNFGRDELKRHGLAKLKKVVVTFIDCHTKTIHGHYDALQKEELINANFSNDFIVQEERLDGNTVQLIAVHRSTIETINAYFKDVVSVEAVVPYPMALRALLKAKSLFNEQKTIIMVDDLKTQAIITLFDQQKFSAPRRISMRSLDYMVSEIKRVLVGSGGAQKELVIVSNNKQWLEEMVILGAFTKEQIIHLDSIYPVLEGLKLAKFTLRFLLPEELIKTKKNEALHRSMIKASVIIGAGLVSFVLYAMANYHLKELQLKYQNLVNQQEETLKLLAHSYQRKLISLFNSNDYPRLSSIYADLRKSLRSNDAIDAFNVSRDKGFKIEASVFPIRQTVGKQVFHGQGVWKQAVKISILEKGLLGFNLKILIKEGDS